MDTWMAHWQERVSNDAELKVKWQIPCHFPLEDKPESIIQPSIYLYSIKYTAIFLTAILTAFLENGFGIPKLLQQSKDVFVENPITHHQITFKGKKKILEPIY